MDASTAPSGPVPPTRATLPNLEPCPTGWDPVLHGERVDVVFCDPWPETGPSFTCGPASAHFPGEAGCSQVGSPCPADRWPTDLDDDNTVFVLVGALPGSHEEGTRTQPFATISKALLERRSATVIALSGGRYDESVELPAGVELRGACAEATMIAGHASTDAVVVATGVDTRITDLTVFGGNTGVRIDPGATATLDGVVIKDPGFAGLEIMGSMEATNVLLRNGLADAPHASTVGIWVTGGGTATVERGVVTGFDVAEINVDGAGSTLMVSDIAVRAHMVSEESFRGGSGIVVSEGASATVQRAAMLGSTGSALVGADPGTTLTVSDSLVEVVQEGDDPAVAVAAQDGASVRVERVMVLDTEGIGLVGVEGHLVAEDVTVLGAWNGLHSGGGGLHLSGGDAELRRVLVEQAEEVGVMSFWEPAGLVLEDVTVRDMSTLPDDEVGGFAIAMTDGIRLEARRVHIERARGVGLAAVGDTAELRIEDLVVRDTLPDLADGSGEALRVENGATVRLERSHLISNVSHTVAVMAPGTEVELIDARIERTLPTTCFGTDCPEVLGGIGAGVYGGATLRMERFVISESALCGAQVAYGADEEGTPETVGGELDLRQGRIENNPMAVNVQVDGYDLTRLTDTVVFRDNDKNIDASALPTHPPPSLGSLLDP